MVSDFGIVVCYSEVFVGFVGYLGSGIAVCFAVVVLGYCCLLGYIQLLGNNWNSDLLLILDSICILLWVLRCLDMVVLVIFFVLV